MKKSVVLLALISGLFFTSVHADSGKGWIFYPAGVGAGQGKHVVLLAGDEEYRSEESLPMLAKILSQRHGFKCTVLFSAAADGTLDPTLGESLSQPETLASADAIITLLRFRKWPDATMKLFDEAIQRGCPVVALRTSTHAFQLPETSAYVAYNDFGKKVLGETWVNHWGHHKFEATRGVIETTASQSTLLQGVKDIFGDSDVYEVYPPADAMLLVRGQVLTTLEPSSLPAAHEKARMTDKVVQGINSPMMPVAWTRVVKNSAGKTNQIFCTTMGAATDFKNEGLRRLVVNATFWGLGLAVPAEADVTPVGDYKPSAYGFGDFRKDLKAADFELPK
jgi:hypothetical protein